MKRATIVLTALVGLLMLVSASSASAAINCSNVRDTFNRSNSATLGSSWTQQAPTTSIEGQRATNPNATFGLATFNGGTGNAACADVAENGAATQYVAIVLDFGGPNDNLFIKVQDNGGTGAFNRDLLLPRQQRTAFARSEDIGPFTSGRFAVARNGDDEHAESEQMSDGDRDQSYTVSGAARPEPRDRHRIGSLWTRVRGQLRDACGNAIAHPAAGQKEEVQEEEAPRRLSQEEV